METALLDKGAILAMVRHTDGAYGITLDSKPLPGLRWRAGDIEKCVAEFHSLVAAKKSSRTSIPGITDRTTKRVLVVDDEPQITSLLKLCLERLGSYVVLAENDSSRVMKVAREFRPDVIVLDIMMPEPDGSELAALLEADPQLAGTPVIFLTAMVSQSEAVNSKFGFDRRLYLAKPVDFEELVQHIDQVGRPK
jgi:CheY-like chemotaxis protein